MNIVFSLPPPFVFESAPDVIVMPDTNGVYVVPDVDEELFFWNGWWWRSWEGRWYRSRSYNRSWTYYRNVPSFYYDLDPGWRGYYRDNDWYGHRWDYERIPQRRLQQNWRGWQNDRYWERRRTWGVQNYQSRSQPQRQELRQQRQEHYQQRPEVQRHQELQKQQQDQQRQQQNWQEQNLQPRSPQNQGEGQRQQHQGKPDDGGEERRR